MHPSTSCAWNDVWMFGRNSPIALECQICWPSSYASRKQRLLCLREAAMVLSPKCQSGAQLGCTSYGRASPTVGNHGIVHILKSSQSKLCVCMTASSFMPAGRTAQPKFMSRMQSTRTSFRGVRFCRREHFRASRSKVMRYGKAPPIIAHP
jgi:hypothetical protein